MKNSVLIASALAAVMAAPLAIGTASAADNEKCYGIAAAKQNDCQTAANSCAGQVEKGGQPTAWIYVPKGTCTKINGGSLTPKA